MMNDTAVELQPSAEGSVPQKRPRDVKDVDEDQTNAIEPASKRANIAASVVATVVSATIPVAVPAAVPQAVPATPATKPAAAVAITPAPPTPAPATPKPVPPIPKTSATPQAQSQQPKTSSQVTTAQRSAPPGVIIDKDYFFADGNWVFRVSNTLFKLPRFLVMRGSPKLHTANMFNLPPGKPLESITESDILVVNESLEDFRALCWGLTATPDETERQTYQSLVDFSKMLSLLYMAQKYLFTKYEKWARKVIAKLCTTRLDAERRNPSLRKCSISDLKRLIILYQKKSSEYLLDLVYCEWTSRLKANPALSTREALDFAEALDLQGFQSEIYYAELTRTQVKQKPGSIAHAIPPSDFNDKQMFCFYRGFWSLSHYWASIRAPPEREKHGDYCARAWETMWDSNEDGGPILDPLGKLAELSRTLSDTMSATTRASRSCHCGYKEYAEGLQEDLLQSLGDHFFVQG
ncbi:hypothetical protein NLJ89_g8014 [Agrocybe chaxingu]|uniref:BTB domain-containing protein n=1 Tax=Agrocybe chaxingu TaxID=84603 RepID=A0A9W8K394_9AGAR|nr:hypothetical protein NLJ89_g8014 [Agrocybe chaxingu]